MRKIKLSQGKEALIDDEDFDRVNQFKWYAYKPKKSLTYYARRSVNGHTIHLHRFVLKIEDNKIRLDHENRNGLDNRKTNLRIANQSQNMINYKRINKTGYRGVRKKVNRYVAIIEINSKRIQTKGFKTIEDAAVAYNEMAKKYHGKFAILNIII